MIKLQGSPLTLTRFPDNTTQVWHLLVSAFTHTPGFVCIEWYYQETSELFEIAQLKQLLDHYGVDCWLYIDYLPFARQDHVVSNDTCFALRPFAEMLNVMKFKHITILDPHSQVALELIKNSEAKYPIRQVEYLMEVKNVASVIAFPDAGAKQKYSGMYRYKAVHATKERDPSTGEVTSVSLTGKNMISMKSVLIVDDLCDGGATFIGLAKKLFKCGAAYVSLFVTHGLFSKGLGPLNDVGIKRIYTAKGQVMRQDDLIVTRPYEELT